MEMRDYLERPTKLYQKIKENEKCAAQWRSLASSLSSTVFDQERVSTSRNTNAPFVSSMDKAMDMEQMIQQQYGELAELKTEVTATIYLLEDPLMQLVLLYRYVQIMCWNDVIEALALPRCKVFRLHKAAISELEEKQE